MSPPAAPSRRTERDPVRHIADLVSGGLELEAESELISLAESRTLDAATRCQLARLSLQIEKPHLARGILEVALKSAPRSTDVRFLCGLAEKALGHLHESLEHFAQVGPETNPDAAYYLSIIHQELGSLDAAQEAIRRALFVSPEDADYLNQLACVLSQMGQHEAALEASETALTLEPQSAGFAFNHAQNLLLAGRFAEAWPLYEARLAFLPEQVFPENGAKPWQDESLDGKSLLVWHEQGLGDTIHFSRFLPGLLERAESVVYRAQTSLCGLMSAVLPGISVVPDNAPLPATDFHVPLLSLPGRLGLPTSGLPLPLWPAIPQVSPPPGSRRKIGFVCRGNPNHPDDAQRSVPTDVFCRLFDLPHAWVCLQKQLNGRNGWSAGVENPASGFRDFADTAGAIAGLDLVISVDTAVAHLAASLGVATWILLPHTPDWRWGLSGPSTPWYPAARLFRQPVPGDWTSVIQSIENELS